MIKTAVGTGSANATTTVTITSPNTKMIRIYGYELSCAGTAALTADPEFAIKDEDGNLLWEVNFKRGVANGPNSSLPHSFIFPRPLFIPVGKNAVLTMTAGGANVTTTISVMYDI